MRGMAPPEEEAWYLLSSSENPLWRRMPNAAEWFEMSIMVCHGQRLGTKKNGVSFYFVFQGFAPMPPKRYPMHSECEVVALVAVYPSLNSLVVHVGGASGVAYLNARHVTHNF